MTTGRKKIVMVGCLQVGYEIISFLLKSGIKIDYFVTIAEEKANKLAASGFIDFTPLAKEYNIPIYIAEKYSLKSASDISFFKKHQFDLLLQGGWQRLFPEEILNTLSIGAIGIHGSSEFLPKGRGRSPINWSLIENKKRFIMHYFFIKPDVDDGDIFHFEMFDINDWDDCNTLYYKNAIITKKVLLDYIPKLLNNDYTVIPQHGISSYYPKRTAEDGKIDWEKTIFEIYNFIRALTKPYPGAFSYIDGKKIFIWKAQPFDTRIYYNNARIGEIVEVFLNGDFLINCNSGLLLVTNYEFNTQINTKLLLSDG
jgi:methionyl-tRNA formyltransferase